MQEPAAVLRQWIAESGNIVFFGGAGVSTESGIPDFRSVDGLYRQTWSHPPEVMLSHTFFETHTEEFFDFYRRKLLFPDARPNAAHLRLAELEREGRLRAVVTQNIDGLHQQAGSRNVLELHGSVHRAYCAACGRAHPASAINAGTGVPRCACGGVIRPDVVLYEEALDDDTVERAVRAIEAAEVLLVAGTSLAVFPAAGLLNYYRGRRLALINLSETAYDHQADLVIHEKIGEVMKQV
ncbi:MAG: NAD-dependent protein deacylase [Clostridiales bacterium]|nr:NAD-dependent protein deacylase [Clostridiales bacterium]